MNKRRRYQAKRRRAFRDMRLRMLSAYHYTGNNHKRVKVVVFSTLTELAVAS